MRSILNIAKREFMATVATRAFIIGLLIMPAMLALMGMVMPRLFNIRSMKIQGQLLSDRSDRPDPARTEQGF